MKVALKEKNIHIGRKLIKKAYEVLGIQAIYTKKKTTKINKLDYKYPYLLNEFKNEKNQVCSSDITYIRVKRGYVYLAVIIDWHTKKILSYKLSNTMDAKGRSIDNIVVERF